MLKKEGDAPRRRKIGVLFAIVAAAVCLLAVAACGTPQTAEPSETNAAAGIDYKEAGFSVFTESDTGMYPDTAWNKNFLNAGNRGCNSCHESLTSVIEGAGLPADHPVPKVGYANDRNVTILDGCLSCHDVHSADYGNYFADAIHNAHYSNVGFTEELGGNCWSCHAINDAPGITEIGNTDWVLWEQVMYEGALGGFPDASDYPLTREFLRLNGHDSGYVTDVAATEQPEINVEMSQDLSDLEDAFVALNHPTYGPDFLYDPTHTFTVSGVNEPREFSLEDLQAMPQTTQRATLQCAVAGSAGHNIYNAEYEGVMLSDIIEACGGLEEGVTGVRMTGWDDWECANIAWPISNYDNAMVALKINGEDMPYEYGGPMVVIVPGAPGGPNCKFIKTIDFTNEEAMDLVGALYQNVPGDVLPAVSAAWFQNDGLEYKLGDTVELTGYAYALATSVAPLDKIEFSTDLGATWTTLDVPEDYDPYQWVTFNFSWTPDTAGTHIIKVRGVNDDGYLSNIDGSIIVTVTE